MDGKNHRSIRLECQVCARFSADDLLELIDHLDHQHDLDEKVVSILSLRAHTDISLSDLNPIECIECSRVFADHGDLETHLKEYEQLTVKWQCLNCDVTCQDQVSMKKHLRYSARCQKYIGWPQLYKMNGQLIDNTNRKSVDIFRMTVNIMSQSILGYDRKSIDCTHCKVVGFNDDILIVTQCALSTSGAQSGSRRVTVTSNRGNNMSRYDSGYVGNSSFSPISQRDEHRSYLDNYTADPDNLNMHVVTSCFICDRPMYSEEDTKRHLQDAHDIRSNVASTMTSIMVCSSDLPSPSEMLTCQVCSVKANSPNNLQRHLRNIHKIQIKIECFLCSASRNDPNSFLEHLHYSHDMTMVAAALYSLQCEPISLLKSSDIPGLQILTFANKIPSLLSCGE